MYLFYCALGPLNAILVDDFVKLGGNFRYFFNDGLMVYLIGLSCFILAYYFFYYTRFTQVLVVKAPKKIRRYELTSMAPVLAVLFTFIVIFVVFQNKDYSGESSVDSSYNYILFFADSLIVSIVIFIFEGRYKMLTLILLPIALISFLILGFRYRIILLLIAGLYYFIVKNKLTMSLLLKLIMVTVVTAYSINFITTNRRIFTSWEFEDTDFSLEVADDMTAYELVLFQTENYSTDFNVLKYLKQRPLEHDYGFSMFAHIFIRATPASFYITNKKPIIPQQYIIKRSFGSFAGRYSGAAVTNIFSYYIPYGMLTVIIFMTLLGGWLGWFSQRVDLDIVRNQVLVVLVAMLLFQEISRGYFPQTFTLLVYLFLTFKLSYKSIRIDSIPN
ncbi:MAG: hypothetical protein WBA16_11885 [Nonlabens sp.]